MAQDMEYWNLYNLDPCFWTTTNEHDQDFFKFKDAATGASNIAIHYYCQPLYSITEILIKKTKMNTATVKVLIITQTISWKKVSSSTKPV